MSYSRGIAAIAFGILAFFWPAVALVTLVFLWGTYALVDGVLRAGGDRRRGRRSRCRAGGSCWSALPVFWPVCLLSSGRTSPAQVLLAFIAAWAIMIGVLQIVGAIQLRKEIDGEWLLGLSGLLSILFRRCPRLPSPARVRCAVVWMIASFAIVVGCLYIALAFRLKQYK